MADLIVRGGRPISGVIMPSGNKNAVLPILCATLLAEGTSVIDNVPEISDVAKLLAYFREIGSDVQWDTHANRIEVTHSGSHPHGDVGLPTGIRSAVLLLAPAIVTFGRIVFDTDAKGCALGVREIDPHLSILSRFGCKMVASRPYLIERPDHLSGHTLWADYASVTATETFLMMASTASGVSTLVNAACEPHVQSLCHFLVSMGAKIDGIGTSTLTVTGVQHLSAAHCVVPDDHHEVATFLAIGAVTDGHITVKTSALSHMTLILRQLGKLGIEFQVDGDQITASRWTRQIELPYTEEMLPKIEAAPWPYYPADLLPQAIGVAVGCEGDIMFWNKVYEGALGWSAELTKFGAKVHLSDPHRLVMLGGRPLRPATVEAPYIIRVVLALFIAAIQIKGVSIIKNADPIRRAHPRFVERLQSMGADVEWA